MGCFTMRAAFFSFNNAIIQNLIIGIFKFTYEPYYQVFKIFLLLKEYSVEWTSFKLQIIIKIVNKLSKNFDVAELKYVYE